MITSWLSAYNPSTTLEAEQALREIMQEIALAGLYRAGFFNHAAFYGGTALRIFHGLDRFSEDLDFSLTEKDKTFKLEPFFQAVTTEFQALGMQISWKVKEKKEISAIDSAFLKADTLWQELTLETDLPIQNPVEKPRITIKLEIDTWPPLEFKTENRLLLKPFSFYVPCFTLPHLFAGKLHALLFRKWTNRVKGRDWYDLEWYVRQGVSLSVNHFLRRATESGDWAQPSIDKDQIIALLREKIHVVSINQMKDDVIPYLRNAEAIEIWSPEYFRLLFDQMKFEWNDSEQ
jgi:predicted nucleotidyltransferase component of viral defense system